MIGFIGGGGKTGLMYLWACSLKSAGYPVIVTTTTKLSSNPRADTLYHRAPDLDAARLLCDQSATSGSIPTLYSTLLTNVHKLDGLPTEWLDSLRREFPQLFFLVECDGSAGRSLKGHLPHEPVVPACTDLWVPVFGLDAIGQPVSDLWVHRQDSFCRLTGAKKEERITESHLLSLLLHPGGYLDKAPAKIAILPFLNKAETAAAWESGLNVAQRILAAGHSGLDRVLIGSVQDNQFRVIA